jgi:hypothetical protein|tara:strand:- start:2911 stop:3132 length:222 start_codon:yes stop_codon:yes gene_type:complete
MAKKKTTTHHIPFMIHSFGTSLNNFNFNPYDTGEERPYPYNDTNYTKKKTDSAVPSAELDAARMEVLYKKFDC